MTTITEERLNEFKTIYEKHYNKKIKDNEVSELAEKFIDLMKYLLSNQDRWWE